MQQRHKIARLTTLAAEKFTLFPANNQIFIKHLSPIFLQQVIDANWAAIETMLAIEPLLMFEVVDTCEINDSRLPENKKLCGLEYACIMRDRYTKDICKRAVAKLSETEQKKYCDIVTSFKIETDTPTPAQTILEDGYVVFQTLVERWLTNDVVNPVSIEDMQNYLKAQAHQMLNSQQSYCLQPFYWACIAYIDLTRRHWQEDPLVTYNHLAMFWQQIDGFAKDKLLPRHMLKRMLARPITTARMFYWLENAEFDEKTYPVDYLVHDVRKAGQVYIDVTKNTNKADVFGINYSIRRAFNKARNEVNALISEAECGLMSDALALELTIIRRLDAVRRSEFNSEQLSLHAGNMQFTL